MKKLFFSVIFLMAAVFAFGQSLEKGNLVGVHVLDLKLKPDVSEDQAVNFVLEKLIPAWEKNYGTKDFLMRGVRGHFAGKYATLTIFKDEKHRDKFFANTNEAAEAFKQIEEAMKETTEEAEGFWYPLDMEPNYNDYVIISGKGEEIKKGVLIGVHNESLTLNKNFSKQQYQEYYVNNFIPAVDSYFPALNINFSTSIRGADSTKIGIFYLFPDANIRAELFDNEDNETQFLKDFFTKYKDIFDGLSKIGTTEDSYTDWIVL